MSEQKPIDSMWQPLIDHLEERHGLTVNEYICSEMVAVVDKCRMDAGGSAVTWILINALYNLNVEELKRLHDEITKRVPEDTK